MQLVVCAEKHELVWLIEGDRELIVWKSLGSMEASWFIRFRRGCQWWYWKWEIWKEQEEIESELLKKTRGRCRENNGCWNERLMRERRKINKLKWIGAIEEAHVIRYTVGIKFLAISSILLSWIFICYI